MSSNSIWCVNVRKWWKCPPELRTRSSLISHLAQASINAVVFCITTINSDSGYYFHTGVYWIFLSHNGDIWRQLKWKQLRGCGPQWSSPAELRSCKTGAMSSTLRGLPKSNGLGYIAAFQAHFGVLVAHSGGDWAGLRPSCWPKTGESRLIAEEMPGQSQSITPFGMALQIDTMPVVWQLSLYHFRCVSFL